MEQGKLGRTMEITGRRRSERVPVTAGLPRALDVDRGGGDELGRASCLGVLRDGLWQQLRLTSRGAK